MSNYQPKDLTGSLFKNDRKTTDTHADYRGDALIEGVAYYVDAWINEKRDGSGKYMSLKFKAKEARQPAPPAPTPAPAPRQAAKPQPASSWDDEDGAPF